MNSNDPWKVLNIKPTKDQDKINRAWRKLASEHHPDKGGDAEKFKRARAAYEQALRLSSKIIEIVQTVKKFKINVQIGCSIVLTKKHWRLNWHDDENNASQCEVTIPAWKMAWGRSHTLLVKNLITKNGHPAELEINVKINDDDIIFNLEQQELIWQPTLELEPVMENRQFTACLNQELVTVTVDDYGNGLLKSHGFLDNANNKINIIVKPKYVWPRRT